MSVQPLPDPRALILKDLRAGRVRGLRDYLEACPGEELAVGRAFVELVGGEVEEVENSSTSIGPFRPLKELGRGGQGVVWLAEDTRLGRKVALKVLSGLGPGAEGTLRRFKREAEIASKLQHPGICGVLDTGVARGVPFIAMQYVEGETLAARIALSKVVAEESEDTFAMSFSDESTAADADASLGEGAGETPVTSSGASKDEIEGIVGLFEEIARALHAAHEAGIVHRDIKPGNIMISREGRPVILDFGLARDEEAEGLTLTGDVFGTPSYMSPEQIGGERGAVDRRSDVYALGVALFETLALRKPFEAPTRQALYQSVLHDDPPRLRQLNRAVSRDLEVVVDTALAKEKDRRYQSAEALADELARVLRLEPIVVRPLGPMARGARWVRRNKLVSAALATVFLTISIALGISLVSLSKTRTALAGETRAREEAEEVTRFFEDVIARVDPGLSGAQVTVLQVLEVMTSRMGEFADRPLVESRLRAAAGSGLLALGEHANAIKQLERALALRERELGSEDAGLPALLITLGRAYQVSGLSDEAEALILRARDQLQASGGEGRLELAQALVQLGELARVRARWSEAEALWKEALRIRRALLPEGHGEIASSLAHLAFMAEQQGRLLEALGLFEEALRLHREALGERHVDTAQVLGDLARCEQQLGRMGEAEAHLREALKIAEAGYEADHPRLANLQWRLASVLHAAEKADAEAWARKALATRRKRLGPEHVDLATSIALMGMICSNAGRLDEGEAFHEEALAMRLSLFDPAHPSVASSYEHLGNLKIRRRRVGEGIAQLRKALERWVACGDSHVRRQMDCRNSLAIALQNSGKLEEAEELFQANLDLQTSISEVPDLYLARAINNLGSCIYRRGRREEALEHLSHGLRLRRKLLPLEHRSLRESLGNNAFILQKLGRLEEAEALHREFIASAEKAHEGPHAVTMDAHYRLGANLLEQKKGEDAERSMRTYRALLLKLGAVPEWKRLNADSLVGATLILQERFEEAEKLIVPAARSLRVSEAGKLRVQRARRHARELYEAWGREAEAAEWRAKEQELLR